MNAYTNKSINNKIETKLNTAPMATFFYYARILFLLHLDFISPSHSTTLTTEN